MRGNRSVRNRTGITVGTIGGPSASKNVIARNRLSHDGNGISVANGRGNLIARNVVVDAHGEGIELGIDFDYGTSANRVVRRNLVKGSGRDGFVVLKRDKNTLLRGNVAIGAGRDGFDIDSRSTTLTTNRAARNAHLGIKETPSCPMAAGTSPEATETRARALSSLVDKASRACTSGSEETAAGRGRVRIPRTYSCRLP